MRQRDEFQAQVEILKTALLLSNIPLPPGIDGSLAEATRPFDLTDSDMASISYRMDDASHQRLHVDWTPQAALTMPQMSQPVRNTNWEFSPSPTSQDLNGAIAVASLPDGRSYYMLLIPSLLSPG